MGIIRGGNAEYEENKPSMEEKTVQLDAMIGSELKENGSSLKLSGKYFSTDEVTILTNSNQVKELKILDLSDNQIGDDGLKILFEAENLSGLEELYLGINYITGKGIVAIAKSATLALKNLKILSVSDNKLTDAPLAELARSGNFERLESLDIGWGGVGNETAKALGEAKGFPVLKKLELERGYIDAKGIEDFIKGGVCQNLEALNLSANQVDDDAAGLLASSDVFPELRLLRLSQNRIGDAGAKALGASTAFPKLTALYLGRNYFTAEGAQAVYETKTMTELKTLVLQEGVETTPGLVNYSRPELLRPGHEPTAAEKNG